MGRFPGHMTKALNTVKKLCHNVDIMVEVRDARVLAKLPFEIDPIFLHQHRNRKVIGK